MAQVQPIFKAKVSSVGDGTKTARVLPMVADGVVTRPYVVLWSMRDGMSRLEVGDEVVCAKFEDGTGIVLCRADGEWEQKVPWTFTAGGSVEVAQNVSAGGEVSVPGVQLGTHTHTGIHGETTPGHG